MPPLMTRWIFWVFRISSISSPVLDGLQRCHQRIIEASRPEGELFPEQVEIDPEAPVPVVLNAIHGNCRQARKGSF